MVAANPYGPNTARIRRFLVRLAALGSSQRAEVFDRYLAVSESGLWIRAELELARVIAESGRVDAQQALTGPLLQLVQKEEKRHVSKTKNEQIEQQDVAEEAALSPIAEPALAALLALLAADLLSPNTVEQLYHPFAIAIPTGHLE